MARDTLSSLRGIQERRTLVHDVLEALRQAIWERQLQPGIRLREEELAEALNVSRGPVREALIQLELEGLVIREPNRGASVARLAPADLEEVYSLRMALEKLAVQLAVRNRSAEHIAQLQEVLGDMSAELEMNVTEKRAADLDIKFHEIIIKATGHKRLNLFWSILRPQIYVFLLSRNVANADFREHMLPGHHDIVDAITERDEERALQLIESHLEVTYSRVFASYREFLETE
ncbi:MAG: GntR family transcriptional regulator [Chloroflexi bacterium]|nr:GntR family transcriptional regulator [Chloroflexota bacterium]